MKIIKILEWACFTIANQMMDKEWMDLKGKKKPGIIKYTIAMIIVCIYGIKWKIMGEM